VGTNDLPLRIQIPLQTMIREWERPKQIQPLEAKLAELEAAHLRVAPEMVSLLDDYAHSIEAYLQTLERRSSLSSKRALPRRTTQETLLHLDELEARHLALKPAQKHGPIVQAESSAASRP
jgi:multidrug resistance efflux pump